MILLGLNPAQWAITIISLLVIGALLKWGRRPEKLAGLGLIAVQLSGWLLHPITYGGGRIAVAFVSVGFLVLLLALVSSYRRWWLIGAAGAQTSSVALWIISLGWPVEIWGGTTVRLLLFVVLLAVAAFGVVEARKAPYARETKP